MCRSVVSAALCAAALALSACSLAKSENPLSPSIAGPIPGVSISAPRLLEPTAGVKIAVESQPLALVLENSSSNGPRPLSYLVEVATDANFSNKVFSRDGIEPGDGRTTVRLPDRLVPERTYYWHARAYDGANTGEWASGVHFNIYTPIVIGEPDPREPAANATVSSLRPHLVVANAPRSGPVGPITYQFELSDEAAFGKKLGVWTAGEGNGQTETETPVELAYSTVYYWHARAADSTTVGPWSRTMAFVTGAKPAPTPPPAPAPGPAPGPSGPIPGDAINLASAIAWNSPSSVASWPVTTKLTRIGIGANGVSVDFDAKGSWPDVVPPGWDGGIAYTLWIGMNIGGQWHVAGAMEYWNGLAEQGGDITRNNQIAVNWTYDCGPMARQPSPGEMVAFFVTAGDQRKKDVAAFHARSQVVLVPFPSSVGQSYSFSDLVGDVIRDVR
ncbi:MAG: hypothetical protein IT176_06015 [Acidobacteria bacterium]|nr:hypothetical protein [Acidobacteriota bacterium]